MDVILAILVGGGICYASIWFSKSIGAPKYFAKFMCVCTSFVSMYFLSDAAVPAYNKPFWLWIMALILGGTFSAISVNWVDQFWGKE